MRELGLHRPRDHSRVRHGVQSAGREWRGGGGGEAKRGGLSGTPLSGRKDRKFLRQVSTADFNFGRSRVQLRGTNGGRYHNRGEGDDSEGRWAASEGRVLP